MSAESSGSETEHGGLLCSVKKLAGTLLLMGQTRLELLSNDFEEERTRLTSMLVWTLVAMFFAALAIVLATFLIVVAFWDSYRLQAISIMIVLFVTGAGMAWRHVHHLSSDKPRLFSASLAEFSKDREQLATPRHE